MTPTLLQSDPDKPVLFFDGHCILCNRTVDFLLKRDKDLRFYLATLQGKTATSLLNKNAIPDSVILFENGRLYFESDAVIRAGMMLGGVYKLLVLLKIFPRFLRDYVYGIVAKKRYSWFGRLEHCRAPDEKMKERFLD